MYTGARRQSFSFEMYDRKHLFFWPEASVTSVVNGPPNRIGADRVVTVARPLVFHFLFFFNLVLFRELKKSGAIVSCVTVSRGGRVKPRCPSCPCRIFVDTDASLTKHFETPVVDQIRKYPGS